MNQHDRQELSSVQKDLGYLTAKAEGLSEDMASVKDVCNQLVDTLQQIRNDISFAKATLRVVKVIGASLAALAAFNFESLFRVLRGLF